MSMTPIPKDEKEFLCYFYNYRTIALSCILSIILDWIILIMEQKTLSPSELYVSFKKGVFTTECPYSLLRTIEYHNYSKFDEYVLKFDASNAVDRVNYCELYNELIKGRLSPLILVLILYFHFALRARW